MPGIGLLAKLAGSIIDGAAKSSKFVMREALRPADAKVKQAKFPFAHSYKEWCQQRASRLTTMDNGWVRHMEPTKEMRQAWIADLPHDSHLSTTYITDLIQAANSRPSLNMIVHYLKSEAANNLDNWERAQLVMQCFDKIRFLSFLHMFH